VLNIFHDQLLGLGQFCGGEGVGLSNNGDDVDTRGQTLHKFDIEFTETVTGGCDEIKEDVDTVVSEARVTLDSGLLSKDVIILALEVADNLAEAVNRSVSKEDGLISSGRGEPSSGDMPGLIVNLVTETGGINDSQGDAGSLLIQLKLCDTGMVSI
jgi:hypothetical protein